MKIFLASDHAGFELKEKVQKFLSSKDYEVVDCGPDVYEPLDDYPDFVSRAAQEVSRDPSSRAIIIGKTGEGEAMVANRFARVRAAVYYGGNSEIATEILKLSRAHNDANILSVGSQFISYEEIIWAIMLWLSAPFSNEERHRRRIAEIETYD